MAAGFVSFVCFVFPRRLCSGSHTASNERTGTGLRLHLSLCSPGQFLRTWHGVAMLHASSECCHTKPQVGSVCIMHSHAMMGIGLCHPSSMLQAFGADCSLVQRACKLFDRRVMPKHALLWSTDSLCVSWFQPDLRRLYYALSLLVCTVEKFLPDMLQRSGLWWQHMAD